MRERFELGGDCVLWLAGGPGSGKSTAIEHLRFLFRESPEMLFIDGPAHVGELKSHIDTDQNVRLVICTTNHPELKTASDTVWTLAAWGRDELIEYLLARHPVRCASVMSRLHSADFNNFGGSPELWRPVLDQLADHDELSDSCSALHTILQADLADAARLQLGQKCLESLQGRQAAAMTFTCWGTDRLKARLLRHRAARLVLAVEFLTERITAKNLPLPDVSCHGSEDLIIAVAERIRGQDAAMRRLQLAMKVPAQQPLAASLLHAVDPKWKPNRARGLNLLGARLSGAEWPNLNLKRACADRADFSHAVLQGVHWKYGSAIEADFRHAYLEGANLGGWKAFGADFTNAVLTAVKARGIQLDMSTLTAASLRDADLRNASLLSAVLQHTDFRRAKLCGAVLSCPQPKACDFQDADLSLAILPSADLRDCNWNGVTFRQANLANCNLEGMELEDVDFTECSLENALLTDSTMTRCCLDRAFLCNAGLAGIDWEGVSLRGAELGGASFHLGSSRSGLVGSPIACEGSRTGFYTDDYLEQDYRPPEDIRKANLCGADLIGADIEGVDFYLVDLRGARYDSFQRAYFRHCGAILENRCQP